MEGIFQQRGNRHRTHSAGNGRNHGGAFFCRFKFNVAAQAAVVQAVDADIDNHRAGLDPFAFDEIRDADARHHNIGRRHFLGQIARFAVADGNRGARQQQFQHLRPADDIRRADDDGFFPFHFHAVAFQQGHHAFGRAGAHQRHFYHQAADIIRMEAVHIFMRQDALQNRLAVYLFRQRQLNQNAVHIRIAVQFVHQCQQLVLRGFRRHFIRARFEPRFFAGDFFVADVNRAGGIVANQYDGQAGRVQPFVFSFGHAVGQHGQPLPCNFFTVDDLCGHGKPFKQKTGRRHYGIFCCAFHNRIRARRCRNVR